MIMMMVVDDTICCSSFLLKPQREKTKTMLNDLVVVDEREEEEFLPYGIQSNNTGSHKEGEERSFCRVIPVLYPWRSNSYISTSI